MINQQYKKNISLVTLIGLSYLVSSHVVQAFSFSGPSSSGISAQNINSTTLTSNSTNQHDKSTTNGSQRSRGGRMLDLDVMAGDLAKEAKSSRDKSLSGDRQSRILSADVTDLSSEPRGPMNQRKKNKSNKLEIKGFIPIVSAEGMSSSSKGGKQFALNNNQDEINSNDDEEDQQDQQPEYDSSSNTKGSQLFANYGSQTSLGHASFPQSSSQSGSETFSSYEAAANPHSHGLYSGSSRPHTNTEFADRARKLALGAGLLATNPLRMVSNLVSAHEPNYMAAGSHQHQATAMNPQECVCVPFFQCKNGYMAESQLSRSQQTTLANSILASAAFFNQNYHAPRALNFSSGPVNEPYEYQTTPTAQQQQLQQLANSISAPANYNQMTHQQQPNLSSQEQQIIMDQIMEQLRKSDQLTPELQQQFQQHQQQLDQASQYSTSGLGQLDERNAANSSVHKQESNGNGTSPADDVQERGFIRDLIGGPGRRSAVSTGFGSMNSGCGLMRTCCKISPLNLGHHQSNHLQSWIPPKHHNQLHNNLNHINQAQNMRPNFMGNLLGSPSSTNSIGSINLLNPYQPSSGSLVQPHQGDSMLKYNNNNNYLHRPITSADYPMGTPCILARSAPSSSSTTNSDNSDSKSSKNNNKSSK